MAFLIPHKYFNTHIYTMIYYYEIEKTLYFAHIILITHPGNNTHALRSGNAG